MMFTFNLLSVVLINLIGLRCGLKLRFLKAFQIILISSRERERTTALRVWSGQWISRISVPSDSEVNWGLVPSRAGQTAAGCDASHICSFSASCRCDTVSLTRVLVIPHHPAIKRLHDLSSWGCNSTVICIVFLFLLLFSCYVLVCFAFNLVQNTANLTRT